MSLLRRGRFHFLFMGYLEGRAELEHGTTIRFFRSTHGVVAKTVTAMLVAGIILYISYGEYRIGFRQPSRYSMVFSIGRQA